MKTYRIFLVVLLVVILGCGAWYFYDTMRDNTSSGDGTLVRGFEKACGSLKS